MKNIKKYTAMIAVSLALGACSLEETNYNALDQDFAYSTTDGYKGLINSCYENIYYLYGKSDGIGLMEMGTDLWVNGSRSGSNGELTNYNENLTPSVGVLNVVWRSLYCTVGYCNTAIYYQDKGNDFTAEDIKPMAAEAYFLRGFSNFHIVEQWGNVVLNKYSIAENGSGTERAERSSEEDFYNLIISDLKFAVNNLPISPSERGRASKKSAMGMLAKVYMQRTRLYAEGSAEYKANADSAFQVATELIDNSTTYGCKLYESTATQSGNAQEWSGDNNKNNSEYLFLQAIDEVNGYNPEGWNRGRTFQYYMTRTTQAANFGMADAGMRYGRANATVWRPTYYLLHECFEPKIPKSETQSELINLAKDPSAFTPDTRYEDAFYYKYYASASKVLTVDLLSQYYKDPTAFKTVPSRMIKSASITGANLAIEFPGANFYNTASYEREDIPDALACYLPNWELDTLKTAKNKRLCIGIDEQFNLTPGSKFGTEAVKSYYRSTYPSLKKCRMFKYVYTNQYTMQDIGIIRLTDVYLIAAEAALAGTHGMKAGLPYLNAVRRHAALSTDAAEMEVNSYDLDYLLKERARELCGEQWRWYDLKRTHRLTQEYLHDGQTSKAPYVTTFDINKHLVRPVPQAFLDQIANPEEFGTNGY